MSVTPGEYGPRFQTFEVGGWRVTYGVGFTKPYADVVVNVTQTATVDRADIDSVAGRLSRRRLAEVWDGVRMVIEPS